MVTIRTDEPSNGRAQMSDVHSLVQQLQAVLGEYGVAFWGRFRPVQLARAAVATPYPLCAVSVGVHICARDCAYIRPSVNPTLNMMGRMLCCAHHVSVLRRGGQRTRPGASGGTHEREVTATEL